MQVWIGVPPSRRPKRWDSIEVPAILFERDLYGHPLAGLLRERKFEGVLLSQNWERVPTREYVRRSSERSVVLEENRWCV